MPFCIQTSIKKRIKIFSKSPFSVDNIRDIKYNNYAFVKSVYDGDTITIVIYYRGEYLECNCRLYGIDCAELRTKDENEKTAALDAKEYVKSSLERKIIWVEFCKEREKYGRNLVKIKFNGMDFNQHMIDIKKAKPYFGGKKQ